jgi:DNA-binding TFAR19-related protein (PDSD5 family)
VRCRVASEALWKTGYERCCGIGRSGPVPRKGRMWLASLEFRPILNVAFTRTGGDYGSTEERPAVRKRKGKSVTRRKTRKPPKSARGKTAKRRIAGAAPRKRLAKAKLKPGAKKARKRVSAVKPPSTPAVETVVTEIEATEVAPERSVGPEEPEESPSAPPESKEP